MGWYEESERGTPNTSNYLCCVDVKFKLYVCLSLLNFMSVWSVLLCVWNFSISICHFFLFMSVKKYYTFWIFIINYNFFLVMKQDVLDPPEDCFRIRMIITLLQTCGHYFDRGSSKRKLDRFLIYFQRYALSKGPLPLDIEFDIQVSNATSFLYSSLLQCQFSFCSTRNLQFSDTHYAGYTL